MAERFSISVLAVINNIYRSAVPAQKYLPERRSATFRHHYTPVSHTPSGYPSWPSPVTPPCTGPPLNILSMPLPAPAVFNIVLYYEKSQSISVRLAVRQSVETGRDTGRIHAPPSKSGFGRRTFSHATKALMTSGHGLL